jgi:hypothetical protein
MVDESEVTHPKCYLVANFSSLEETFFLHYDSQYKNFIPKLEIEGAAKLTLESANWAVERLNTVCTTLWEVVEIDLPFIPLTLSAEKHAIDKA